MDKIIKLIEESGFTIEEFAKKLNNLRYKKLKVLELKRLAKERARRGYSHLRRDKLVDLLELSSSQNQPKTGKVESPKSYETYKPKTEQILGNQESKYEEIEDEESFHLLNKGSLDGIVEEYRFLNRNVLMF